MSSLINYMDRRSPIAVTIYITGSGNHTFHTKAKSWKAVIVAAGGGAGRATSNVTNRGASGGSAGATLFPEGVIQPGETTIPYIVGAPGQAASTAGTDGTSGGFTQLGNYRAAPGIGGSGTTTGVGIETIGGLVSSAWYDASNAFLSTGGLNGIPGGWGGKPSPGTNQAAFPGGAPGFPTAAGYTLAAIIAKVQRGSANGGAAVSGQISGGGGGDSSMGKGGAGGNGGTTPGVGQDATGYGAGGGAGGSRSNGASGLSGDGTGGYICIKEYID